jgi:endo-1,4-beta-xylanase
MNHLRSFAGSILGVILLMAACSAGSSNEDTSSGTGGQTSMGGAAGRGGASGVGGAATTGGTTSSGGSQPDNGGAPGTGGNTGGTTSGCGSRSTCTGGAAGSGGASDAGAAPDGAPAIDGGAGVTKFAGNITTRGSVRSDFSKYWNQITPENEGKWGSVQPSQGNFNWNSLDAIYKYTNDNNIVFKEHCFVWGSQQPGWVNTSNGETAIRAWMQAFCQRYPKTKIIDVVNEPPPHTTPSYKNGIGGDGTSGWDWIANSFKWAREACPNATLVLNDYNTIEQSGDNNHIIDIVTKIKKAGAPIDAVGAQAHGTANMSADTLKKYIDNIATQTSLPVFITEFDLSIADDSKQKAKMEEHFTMFWNDSNVKGVTVWGYVVGATWVPNSGLIQSDGTFRPAMTWLMNFLGR